jgi:GPI ethanolamine phosphate transferase 3 subunit O
MGDDTWLTVFPTAFHPEMSHDFDSFNVEDLHTVDNGVIANLFPLLTNSTHAQSWDFLIGHFLGVDHVGHRVGPDHPTMLEKQQQMNDVLQRVVDALDEDTLLVVLGDHGMDRKGDHGGDGDLEVSSGLWIYSKGLALSAKDVPTSHLPHKTFPGEPSPHRSIQQIDLVPTLSLLLGLPIPFNNLGTVIPELFWRDRSGSDYTKALDINARQVYAYLDAYRNSPSGGELDGAWSNLEASWMRFNASKPQDRPETTVNFTRLALETCRSLWARFNPALMVGGLGVVTLSLVVGWGVYERSRSLGEWDTWTTSLGRKIASSSAIGAALASVVPTLFRGVQQFDGVSLHQFILFGVSVGSGVRVLISAPPKLRMSWTTPVLLLHPIAFLSNSYTFWEDRAIPFFLLFTLVPPLLTALSAPTTWLRYRILAFSALFAACVRLMAISTVCREEQQPWCSVTFFSGSGAAETPILVRVFLIPAAVLVPYGIRRVLAISKSDNGIASLLLPYVLPPALIAGSTCWLLESLDSSGAYQYPGYLDLRQARTILAWTSVLATLGGTALWALVPVALHVSSERTPAGTGHKTEVRVLGFANAYGAPFAVLWTLVLALVWLAAQPSAQITLALATAALLAHLELVDAARDARALQASFSIDPAGAVARLQQGLPTAEAERAQGATAVTVDEMAPLALLAQLAFFASGHQATFVSLQWKAAFVLTPTLSYPLSPLFMTLNTLGPTTLIALAVPLLGTWNVAPLAVVPDTSSSPGPGRRPASSQETQQQATTSQARVAVLAAVRAALGLSQYFGALLLGSALSAAWLRRHLMVWKVFAPRYMLGAVELLCVDIAVLAGLWLGVGRVVTRINRMFALPAPAPSTSTSSRGAEGQRL